MTEQQENVPKKFLGIELTFKPTPKTKKPKAGLPVGLSPSANFLPKKLREKKSLETAGKSLFRLSVVTVSACFLAFVAANAISFSGQLILDDAQLRLAQVKAEKAKYQDIQSLEAAIRFQEAARLVATSPQVNFQKLFGDLTDQLPKGASYSSLLVNPFSAAELALKVDVSMQLPDYPSLQKYLTNLPSIPAFQDFKLSSVSSTGNGISVVLTVFLNKEIYERPYSEPLVIGSGEIVDDNSETSNEENEVSEEASSSAVIIKGSVFFEGNSAELSAAAIRTLEALAARVPESVLDLKVTITGYVYPTADTSQDRVLSANRAAAVRSKLEELGVAAQYRTVGVPNPLNASPSSRRADVAISYEVERG